MRLADIGDAERLARKLDSLNSRRGAWAQVDMNTSLTTSRINAAGTAFGLGMGQLPNLDDDKDMHQAIVEAVVAEYNKRITATKSELRELGVTL